MNPQSTDLDYADPASSPLTFGVREGGLLILKVKGVPKRTNRCTSGQLHLPSYSLGSLLQARAYEGLDTLKGIIEKKRFKE